MQKKIYWIVNVSARLMAMFKSLDVIWVIHVFFDDNFPQICCLLYFLIFLLSVSRCFPPQKSQWSNSCSFTGEAARESNLSLSHKYPGRVFIIVQVRQKHIFFLWSFLLNLRDELDELGVFLFQSSSYEISCTLVQSKDARGAIAGGTEWSSWFHQWMKPQIGRWHNVEGRNPANYLECTKRCKTL